LEGGGGGGVGVGVGGVGGEGNRGGVPRILSSYNIKIKTFTHVI